MLIRRKKNWDVAGENENGPAPLENNLTVFYKCKYSLAMWTNNLILGYSQ